MYNAVDLKTRLDALKGAYPATRQVTLRAVVRWELTDAHRYDIRPFFFELNGLRRGQIVDASAGLTTYFRCGFDASGRLVAESYYVGGQLVVEFFWRYSPDFAEGVVFYLERPSEIVHARFDGANLSSYRHYDSRRGGKYTHERCLYEAGYLSRVTRRVETGSSAAEFDYALRYDSDGVLERIMLRPNTGALRLGGVPVVYQRREALYVPLQSGHEFTGDLVSAIVAALASQHTTEPVCAVVLSYAPDAYCPPVVFVMTERSRRDRVASGEAGLEALWTPDSDPLEVDVPRESCAMFDGLVQEDAAEILDAVAYELTVSACKGAIPVTPDFVAFALHFEHDSALERIYASAPAEKVALLQSGGWL